MSDRPASVLIVDLDPESGRMLAGEARARGYRAQTAATAAAARAILERDDIDVLVVDVAPDGAPALELGGESGPVPIRAEVIVMTDRPAIPAARPRFAADAFPVVGKQDPVQLFAAVARALERQRLKASKRRLRWELRTVSDIASGVARSLDLDDVIGRALQGLVRAMEAEGGSIHLQSAQTGDVEPSALIGSPAFRRAWLGEGGAGACPAAAVLSGRTTVIGELPTPDGLAAVGAPLRSTIGVPLLAGDEMLGALTLGSAAPRRFDVADQQLLATIGSQIVIAIQNARLHQFVLKAKREWEQTFDAIDDPIGVFTGRGELLRGNRALARYLALPVTALRGLTCGQVGFCRGGCSGAEEACPAIRQNARWEVTLPNAQVFSVTTFPIRLPGEGPAVVQVAKDVTEEIRGARRLQQMSSELAETNGRLVAALDRLRAAQVQLLQSEKLSAMGHLVAGVAHELNNPLTSVIGYAQLLEEEFNGGGTPRDRDDVARDLRRIAEEAERAARIVRNLLAFARRQASVRDVQDLADICTRVIALREYEFRLTGVELHTDLPTGLPPVFADSGQLQQVLLNLVLNAEQAMRDSVVRRLSISARLDGECDGVELAITDSGHGIDGPNLSRVFDPFFTTRDVGQGTGLGLSICYGIIRDHGGTIRVESTSGAGTAFHVTLPARLADPAVRDTHVLVGHADQGEREFLAAAFRGWGYATSTAATLQEALALHARPGLQIAVLDRGIVAADLEAWRAARAVSPVAAILTSVRIEDAEVERFGRDFGLARLAPPTGLAALRAAVRACTKECV